MARRTEVAELSPEARALLASALEDTEELTRIHDQEARIAARRRQKMARANTIDTHATLGRIAREVKLSEPFVTKQVRAARKEDPVAHESAQAEVEARRAEKQPA